MKKTTKMQLFLIAVFLIWTIVSVDVIADAVPTWAMNVVDQTNNPSINEKNIFVIVKGLKPGDDVHDVLAEYDAKGKFKGYAKVDGQQFNVKDYCYPLSQFSNHTVPLPPLRSGRIYFSFNKKMDMGVDIGTDGRVTLKDPTCFPAGSSPSLYTYWQHIEYTWLNVGGDGDGTWINPTAVDFVSIPIFLEYNGKSGGIKNITRKALLNKLTTAFNKSAAKSAWNKLIVTDPMIDSQILRIVAPGKAIVLKSTDPKILSREFQPDYLDKYIDFVWSYYKQPDKYMIVDCTEIKGDTGYSGSYKDYSDSELMIKVNVGSDGFMHLTNTPKTNPAINIKLTGTASDSTAKPSTFAIFAGDGAEDTSPFKVVNHTLKSLVIRQLCCAFDTGILPQAQPITFDKNKVTWNKFRKSNELYKNNPLTTPKNPTNLPWYDLYAGTIHSVIPNLYSYAFDDVIGLDGTCHGDGPVPSGTVTVTLGDISDIDFSGKPAPDDTEYKVLVGSPPGMKIDIPSKGKTIQAQNNSGWLDNVKSPLTLILHKDGLKNPLTINVNIKTQQIDPPHDTTITQIPDPGGWSINPSAEGWPDHPQGK
jgi:hypothetical protein